MISRAVPGFVIVGAGAIGGVVGARLAGAGHAVTLIARGAHHDAIRDRGLTVHAPSGSTTLPLHVVSHPAQLTPSAGSVLLLAVKSQDAAAALRDLGATFPTSTPIVCLTNGVEAERLALRWFERVYGCYVASPCTHLEPGVVETWGAPVAGVFDVGRYPHGSDPDAESIAAAFTASGLWAGAVPDIMSWKRNKLLANLSNAIEALCGPIGRTDPLGDALRAEAVRCFAAARLAVASDDEAAARRGDFHVAPIAGRIRTGGSTYQSLQRGALTVECELLNGEITLLGRLHDVPTPLNAAVLREITRAVAAGVRPGTVRIDELVARITA